jgi:hypothetical protein
VPIAVVVGMVAITFTGLADDVWGWDPRLKIAGQRNRNRLGRENVGVNVGPACSGRSSGTENLVYAVPTRSSRFDLVY